MPGSHGIQIGGINLTVQPRPQADPSLLGISDRAMAYAMDGMPGVRQFPRQIASDKAVCAGDPDAHGYIQTT
jgi:hypothetical protein